MGNSLKRRALAATKRAIRWGDRRVPAGVRSLLGLLCIAGGLFGFLPVLGFWMLPIGVALVSLDIPPLRRRLLAWQKTRSQPNNIENKTRTKNRGQRERFAHKAWKDNKE